MTEQDWATERARELMSGGCECGRSGTHYERCAWCTFGPAIATALRAVRDEALREATEKMRERAAIYEARCHEYGATAAAVECEACAAAIEAMRVDGGAEGREAT